MDYNDIAELTKELESAAKAVGRTVTKEDIRVFYDYLKKFSIKMVRQGIKWALSSRSPDDQYLKTAMVTVPEIIQAIEEIERGDEGEGFIKCSICNGSRWLTNEVNGILQAYPCECLADIVRKAIAKKKRPGSEQELLDRYRKIILRWYEAHEKRMGGLKEEPPF